MPESFSKFFTFEELTNSANHPGLVAKNREDAMKYINAGKRLSKLLESIRHYLGDKPLTVTNGFRNLELNKAVGSKTTKSKHLLFEAADVVPTSMSVETAFKMIMTLKEQLPDLRKVIIEKVGGKEWLHIEVKMKAYEEQSFYVTTDANTYTRIA